MKIIAIIAVCLLAVITFALVTRLSNDKKIETQTLSSLGYKIGGLDSTSGGETNSTASIVSKEYHEVENLDVELEADATVEYKIFYYDNHKDFVSCTSSLDDDFSGTIPSTAKFFKIVITPTNDSEVNNLIEVRKYANMVVVTYGGQAE